MTTATNDKIKDLMQTVQDAIAKGDIAAASNAMNEITKMNATIKREAQQAAHRAVSAVLLKGGAFLKSLSDAKIDLAALVGRVNDMKSSNHGKSKLSKNLWDKDGRGTFRLLDAEGKPTGDEFAVTITNVSEVKRRIAERKAGSLNQEDGSDDGESDENDTPDPDDVKEVVEGADANPA